MNWVPFHEGFVGRPIRENMIKKFYETLVRYFEGTFEPVKEANVQIQTPTELIPVPKNMNYCATIVEIKEIYPLAGCDNLVGTKCLGCQVLVGKDTKVGELGIFFPVETALSKDFLANNNLFRKPEFGNKDITAKPGYFEEHGRVRAVKFRKHNSEGIWLPLNSLAYTGVDLATFTVGLNLDKVGNFEICRKYVPKRQRSSNEPKEKKAKTRWAKDLILEDQFRFHYDTAHLKRNIHNIKPETDIIITSKWHGTSCVLSNLLTVRELNWFEKLLKKFGVKIVEQEYNFVWSSRQVVKGVGDTGNSKANHFYKSDVWLSVGKRYQHCIPKGVSVYGEIVGYTEDGGAIQRMNGKAYHYGCAPYTNRFMVYRVTYTNVDGKVVELTWRQLKNFCELHGFDHVIELYHGKAVECLMPNIAGYFDNGEVWEKDFIEAVDHLFMKEKKCKYNNNEVWAEGIVVRIDDKLDHSTSYKHKHPEFVQAETLELDAGVVDIETEESENDA